MKNVRISAKLSVAFIAVNVIYILSIIALLLSYMMSNERLNTMNSTAIKPQAAIQDVRDAILRERLAADRLAALTPDSIDYAEAAKGYEAEHQKVLASIAAYVNVSSDEAAKTIALELQSYYENEYSAFLGELIRRSGTEDSAASITRINSSQEIEARMDTQLETAAGLLDERIDSIIDNAHFGLVRLFIISAVVIVLVIAFALYVIKYMQRVISKRIERLTDAANLLAAGRLDIQIDSDSTDEIGRLSESILSIATSINNQTETLSAISKGDLTVDIAPRGDGDTMNIAIKKMIDSLNHMFGKISDSTERVSSGSKQIAVGAQSLAQGALEQSSAVEQVSHSISGVTQTTQDNFAMAKQVAQFMDSVNSNAISGSELMGNMAQAVQEISFASQAISKVMKVIDDIAFQTNILALNAAVEAARAGRHGKGFAVVAEEVRNLAAKSAEAAKDTGKLIANSMEKAALGNQIAEEAVQSFELIVSGIYKSTNLLNDIARISEQQNTAIHHINQSIDQVAQVVQQNSTTAKESAFSSGELSNQSDVLEDLISQFKIKRLAQSR